MINCSYCQKETDDEYYTEEIYFKEYGKICKECYEKHCKCVDSHGLHFCCQDFKDMNGEYVHYNMPWWPGYSRTEEGSIIG